MSWFTRMFLQWLEWIDKTDLKEIDEDTLDMTFDSGSNLAALLALAED